MYALLLYNVQKVILEKITDYKHKFIIYLVVYMKEVKKKKQET